MRKKLATCIIVFLAANVLLAVAVLLALLAPSLSDVFKEIGGALFPPTATQVFRPVYATFTPVP